MTHTLGFIGLGMMGHGMATNLLKQGHALRLIAHRQRANIEDLLARGATEVSSRAAMCQGATAVILCVTGTPQVEAIVYGEDGLLEAVEAGQVVIDCSTAEPGSTARIREAFAARGVAYVDAPLARTPKEAAEGRLNTMVGASDADFARVQPILSCFCENVIHVGPPGHGHVLKLINNMLAMTTAAAIAEAVATATKAGLSLQRFFDVVSAGGVNSGIFQMMVGKALQGDMDGLKFSIANGQKDLRYYTHLTESLPVVSHLAEAVHQSFVQAACMGYGEKFIPSLMEAQERINGIEIVSKLKAR